VLLAIYLNDHLAGSTAGRELARRPASSNRGTSYGPFLRRLAVEIQQDRTSLLALMRKLDVAPDPLKVAGGWAMEKAGRLKLNGRLLSYSPYSRVVELEVLKLGVQGKLSLWLALREIQDTEPRLDGHLLQTLLERAEGQVEHIELHRLRATAEAFAAEH
jgi:hypothetical protein